MNVHVPRPGLPMAVPVPGGGGGTTVQVLGVPGYSFPPAASMQTMPPPHLLHHSQQQQYQYQQQQQLLTHPASITVTLPASAYAAGAAPNLQGLQLVATEYHHPHHPPGQAFILRPPVPQMHMHIPPSMPPQGHAVPPYMGRMQQQQQQQQQQELQHQQRHLQQLRLQHQQLQQQQRQLQLQREPLPKEQVVPQQQLSGQHPTPQAAYSHSRHPQYSPTRQQEDKTVRSERANEYHKSKKARQEPLSSDKKGPGPATVKKNAKVKKATTATAAATGGGGTKKAVKRKAVLKTPVKRKATAAKPARRKTSVAKPVRSEPKAVSASPVAPVQHPPAATAAAAQSSPSVVRVRRRRPSHLQRPHADAWEDRFRQLVLYKKQHGHCNVPLTDLTNADLARWVKRQRYHYKLKQRGQGSSSMSDEREARLNSLGFSWEKQRDQWEEKFNELVEFNRKHGHSNVNARTAGDNPSLVGWAKSQRRHYKLYGPHNKDPNKPTGIMSKERLAKLESIGFVWDGRSDIGISFKTRPPMDDL